MTTRYSSNYETEYQTQRKKVFKNSEIEHIWAQQKLDEGRNPQNNVFFEGPSIFSYGHHFETARFVKPGVVLITTRTYSITTRGHVSAARGAVSHLKAYNVPTFDDHNVNATAYITDLTNDLESISRMRKETEWSLKHYARSAKEAAEYVCTFKVRKALKDQIMGIYARCENPFTPEVLAELKKRQAAARVAGKAAREEKAKRLGAERQDAILRLAAWKDGHAVGQHGFNQLPIALRVKDNEIQTTRGASVPVIEARKLWRALRTDAGSMPGMRIGHYTVTRVDPENDSVIVGCHVIPLREVTRMAVRLGFEKEVA